MPPRNDLLRGGRMLRAVEFEAKTLTGEKFVSDWLVQMGEDLVTVSLEFKYHPV